MNEGAMSSVLGLAGWPREAEEVMIARDLILAAGSGRVCTSRTSPPPAPWS
jgi:dihydroorotase